MDKKLKELQKGLNIDDKADWKRAVAVNHVIDTNKRGKNGFSGEPKMTD